MTARARSARSRLVGQTNELASTRKSPRNRVANQRKGKEAPKCLRREVVQKSTRRKERKAKRKKARRLPTKKARRKRRKKERKVKRKKARKLPRRKARRKRIKKEM